ncbi:uncharacterized protein K452DRAFT_291071 [Aplosporella prunicola CBS 121167]|uniref:UBC core domain-containing protein n=1 Tax=Aplosporella prunicola CBS 121167 TaxID=1176127 RepID=A0A6A6B1H4_9PEZI|nr:uncharacterized protein K452DRAFT_291071 [Aplosporella prunicola CBS 121167]KAF2138029.1 hypothetical protein K452DRAFT_291071 [Aplosporella prunicola CBS 121167]
MPLLGPTLALPALQKQNLLVEFASLRHTCPDGIYMSILPEDASIWTGVIFVRKGPYAPAILRVQISFPSTYPAVPPLVTFSTDIFHPLVTPLTTYTYTTGSASGDTVSATDEQRLPPGGFSLRHGFPQWFQRPPRSPSTPRILPGALSVAPVVHEAGPTPEMDFESPPVVKILKYVQDTFTDEAILDTITVESAANPGAYHAWQSYRETQNTEAQPMKKDAGPPATRSRRPGEWNWEGVWEERVKKGIQMCTSDAVVHASGEGGDEVVRFAAIDAETYESAKNRLMAEKEKET